MDGRNFLNGYLIRILKSSAKKGYWQGGAFGECQSSVCQSEKIQNRHKKSPNAKSPIGHYNALIAKKNGLSLFVFLLLLQPFSMALSIWEPGSMAKVKKDDPLQSFDGKVTIFSARNEYERFQLVLYSDTSIDATVDVSPLTGPSLISQISVYEVFYVNADGKVLPDPLKPLENPVSLIARENRPIWFKVKIPIYKLIQAIGAWKKSC